MPRFLTFALVAPLASFGALAVGERRGSFDRPARSAVLGLIGACLGVEREDDDAQAALAAGYGLALLCHSSGRLLPDYHTAQVPPTLRGRRFARRADELAAPGLATILSRRDYRSGAWHLGALWTRGEDVRWSLDAIAAGMERPIFTPYLGRKSCPLGLPLAPRLAEAPDAPAALLARHDNGPEALLSSGGRDTLRRWLAEEVGEPVIASDVDGAAGDSRTLRTEFRRDQPRNRRRWQFDLRQEAILRGVTR